jgi:hypothetical protein
MATPNYTAAVAKKGTLTRDNGPAFLPSNRSTTGKPVGFTHYSRKIHSCFKVLPLTNLTNNQIRYLTQAISRKLVISANP